MRDIHHRFSHRERQNETRHGEAREAQGARDRNVRVGASGTRYVPSTPHNRAGRHIRRTYVRDTSRSTQHEKHIPKKAVLIGGVLVACVIAAAAILPNAISRMAFAGGIPKTVSVTTAKVDKSAYATVQKSRADLTRGDLIVVDSDHPYSFSAPTDNVRVADRQSSSYTVPLKGTELSAETIEPLNAMMDAYSQATGKHDVTVLSGYRGYAQQKSLYERRSKEQGAQEASKWVAQPGVSEHHTGLAFDFSAVHGDFEGKGDQSWFARHSAEYGFVVRYEKNKEDITHIDYEPWHFRYVGKPHAQIMQDKDMCLEEYVAYLRQFTYDKKHLRCDGYEIYYVPASPKGDTAVAVPKDKPYSVSGDNSGGFIVTVKL